MNTTYTLIRTRNERGEIVSESSAFRDEYRFSELSPSAQDHAAQERANAVATWIEPDELRDDDYWQEKARESGFTIHAARKSDGTSHPYELAVYWDSFPWTAYFCATVNVPEFVRSLPAPERKTYRLLLSAIERGEIGDTVYVGREDSRETFTEPELSIYDESGYIPCSLYEPDIRLPARCLERRPPETRQEKRYARLVAQARRAEDAIQETYEEFRSWIADCLEREFDYRTSLDAAREYLSDFGGDYWYDENGDRL